MNLIINKTVKYLAILSIIYLSVQATEDTPHSISDNDLTGMKRKRNIAAGSDSQTKQPAGLAKSTKKIREDYQAPTPTTVPTLPTVIPLPPTTTTSNSRRDNNAWRAQAEETIEFLDEQDRLEDGQQDDQDGAVLD